LIVSQDIDGVRAAALELMVESLREEDTDRVVANLLAQNASPETLAKAMPRRTLADAYYSYAHYIMWLRSMRVSEVQIDLLADEAEGLRAIETARQEFERDHPGCPRCSTRQYSRSPIKCRKCGMDFTKGR
jgi:hypothetical protein